MKVKRGEGDSPKAGVWMVDNSNSLGGSFRPLLLVLSVAIAWRCQAVVFGPSVAPSYFVLDWKVLGSYFSLFNPIFPSFPLVGTDCKRYQRFLASRVVFSQAINQ